MKLTPLNAPQAPLPAGGYAQAFEVQGAGKLLFISGQIPQTAGGEVPDDFEAQAALVWRNVLAQLHAAGLGVDALVKVTTFLASREHAEANREARQHA
nr:RidA family protein [Ottowia sp.]